MTNEQIKKELDKIVTSPTYHKLHISTRGLCEELGYALTDGYPYCFDLFKLIKKDVDAHL